MARFAGMVAVAVLALAAGRAGAASYYLLPTGAVSVGFDGQTLGPGNNNTNVLGTSGTDWHLTTQTTDPASATSYNARFTATTAATWYTFGWVYMPSNYTVATLVNAAATARLGLRSTNLTDSWQLFLYGYDPVTGTSTQFASSGIMNTTNTGAAASVNFTFTGTNETVAQGSRVKMEIRFRGNTSGAIGRVYFNGTAANQSYFTITETAASTGDIRLITGTNPAVPPNVCPGDTVYADQFGFTVTGAADRVSALTVSGLQATTPLSAITVSDDTGATITSLAPTGNTQAFSWASTNLAAPIGTTYYRLYFTAKDHATLGATQPAAVTPIVLDTYTATNTKTAGSDTANGFTIDNTAQANPGAVTVNGATGTSLNVSWGASTGASMYVVYAQKGATPNVTPTDGPPDPGLGTPNGTTAWVAYVGTNVSNNTIGGLDPGSSYTFKVFARDACYNWSTSTTVTGTGSTLALPATTVGNGTDPGAVTLAPGGPETPLDAATFQATGGAPADSVTGLTVSLLPAGSYANIAQVRIMSASNCTGTQYFTTVTPSGDAAAFSGGTPIPAPTASATPAYVCITPKSHANMPAVPGQTFDVTGTVTSITCTNTNKVYQDTASATVTIDNLSPGNATWGTVTPGDQQVVLNWTNPADADFSQVVVVRGTATITGTPTEGQTYAQGNALGSGTVRYVGPLETFTDNGLTNGTSYYYRIFAVDTHGNYSQAGVETGPVTPVATPPKDGRIVYSVNSSTPAVRDYDYATNFGTAANTVAGAIPSFMVNREAPTRNEHIAGYVTTGGALYVYRWNGATWVNETSAGNGWGGAVTVGGNGVNGRRFDIAYESISGDAVVVYSTDVAGGLAYRTWNGTAWSAATPITEITATQLANAPAWVKLLPRPTSDEIALTVADGGATATANSGDLASVIWSGSAWQAGTVNRHSTSLYTTGATAPTGSLQNDLFDQSWETKTGGLYVFFTQATTPNNAAIYWDRASWGTPSSLSATARTPPLQMVAASDPLSDAVFVSFGRSASTTVYASFCAAGACGTAGTVTGVLEATPAINKKQLAAAWLVSGSPDISYPVVMAAGATAGQILSNRATYNGTAWAWGTANTYTATGTGIFQWLDVAVDPVRPDTLMLTASDANSDLWAKRLVFVGATPSYTWTNADGGAALTATLNSITTQNFSFAYTESKTVTILEAANPGNSTIANNMAAPLDAFTLLVRHGTAPVTSVTFAGLTGTASMANVFVSDSATCDGQIFGTLANPGATGTITTSGLSATTASTYYLCMTADTTTGSATGYVSGLSATGFTVNGGSAAGTTVTIVAPSITVANVTPEPASSTIANNMAAALDAFRLTVLGGPAAITSVSWAGLTGTASLRNVFVNSAATCDGTTYGTQTTLGASGSISTTGLSLPSGDAILYLCATANTVASSAPHATGYASTVAASGFSVSGASAAGTTVTVVAPDIVVAAAANPPNATIKIDQYAAMDAFTLTVRGGPAAVTSVSWAGLTGTAAIRNVFINSAATCDGTTYGTQTTLAASGTITTTGLSVPNGTSTYYFCVTGNAAGTSSAGYVTTVVAAGFAVTANATTGGATITVTAKGTITVAAGTDPAPNPTISYGWVAALDAFTLTITSGPASINSVSFSGLTGTASMANVFVNSAATCDGTTYGMLATPAAAGTITTSGFSAATGTTWYLCMTASSTAGTSTGYASANGGVTAVTALGFTVSGNSTVGSRSVTVSGQIWDGNPTKFSRVPAVSILNPMNGATLSLPARVQIRASSPGLVAWAANPVKLIVNGGAPVTATLSSKYPSTAYSGVWEATLAAGSLAAGSSPTLRATATNAVGTAYSATLTVNIVAAGFNGDGNLVVRDNSGQVCADCHSGTLNHTSEFTGTKYGSWSTTCRDCHAPHRTKNVGLVRESITPPAITGATSSKAVKLYKMDTGYSTAPALSAFANDDSPGPTGVCQACHTRTTHFSPAGDVAHKATQPCISCHTHESGFKGSCVGCHASEHIISAGPLANGVNVRRNVVAEFGQTWSHKRSAGRAVGNWDCVACHMEGDSSNGLTSSVHADGYVNLRDPDTGQNIKGVTFIGGSGSDPGHFEPTSTDLVFDRFSRDLSVTLENDPNYGEIAAIQINNCLKCHDADGAASPAARVPGGTAAKPFNTTIAGAGYTGAGVTASGVTGGVTDINESFKTTNSSYHPVTGKQNNWYAKLTRMATPWNVTGRGGTLDLTSWGDLISCWDCHALPADAGIITKTVTAHGGTATLRGYARNPNTGLPALNTNEATLCKVCHAGYSGGTNTHGANSALSSSTNGGMSAFVSYGCTYCHGTSQPTDPGRPVRAQDAHGNDSVPNGAITKTTRWLAGGKPYAFIRNTQQLANHSPATIGGVAPTPARSCEMRGTGDGGGNDCNQGAQSFTAGGTF